MEEGKTSYGRDGELFMMYAAVALSSHREYTPRSKTNKSLAAELEGMCLMENFPGSNSARKVDDTHPYFCALTRSARRLNNAKSIKAFRKAMNTGVSWLQQARNFAADMPTR